MPNLMLTTRCNFSCSYCFGMDFMQAEGERADMSRQTYLDLVTWLQKKPYPGKVLHLMGGEPTLHKDFVWMAKNACDEGFDVAVFSNAATPNAASYAKQLKDLPIRWIVNVNPPNTRRPEEDTRIRESLNVLGERATLTFNIIPSTDSKGWAVDLISRYGLARRIKVGLVLPTLSHQNRHLQREEYPAVAKMVVDFARTCDLHDVALEYECGIEWCTFTPEQLGMLWYLNSRLHSCCDSILDITPDGRLVYCLPLAMLRQVHYSKFKHYIDAKKWFESKFSAFRPLGSTPNCFSCNLMETGHCRGGCLARILGGAKNVNL